MPPSNPIHGVWAERIRQGVLALFLAQWVLVWIRLLTPVRVLDSARWPEGLLLVLSAATMLAILSRQLPAQNVIAVATLTAALGAAAHVLGAVTAVPFGPFIDTSQLGQMLFYPLPWAVPMIWMVFLLASRGVARLVLHPWHQTRNYGFWLLGLTVVLVVLLDAGLEPFAARVKHYRLWAPPNTTLTWYGTPWLNFVGWGTVSGLILTFTTPWLINKRPTPLPAEYHSLLIWALLNALFATAAIVHQLWGAAALTGVGALSVIVFAFRGMRQLERRVAPTGDVSQQP